MYPTNKILVDALLWLRERDERMVSVWGDGGD
jgi:hypothetical protein